MRGTSRETKLATALGCLALVALSWRWMDALGDTFWYVAVGRLILHTGALPRHDPFTFTASLASWTPLMPASYALFAAIQRELGLLGLLAICALIEAAVWIGLWLWCTTEQNRWWLLPVAMLGLVIQRADLAARGQVFGDACFALLLGLVAASTQRSTARWLPALGFPLAACWVNLHPSVLLGLFVPPVLGAALLCQPGSQRFALRRLGALWAALLAGSLVTPFGPNLLLEQIHLAALPSTRSIDLFRSPAFASLDVAAALLLAAFALSRTVAMTRVRATDAVLLATLLFATLTGRRYLPLLLMAVLVVLGKRCRPVWRDGALARGVRAGIVASCLGAIAFGFSVAKDPLQNVPAGVAAHVRLSGNQNRVFAPYHWGGYFDYVLGPTHRVFVDGRNQLFDESLVLDDHGTIIRLAPGWDRLLDVYGIDIVVAERGSALAWALKQHPGWSATFEDRLAVEYERRHAR